MHPTFPVSRLQQHHPVSHRRNTGSDSQTVEAPHTAVEELKVVFEHLRFLEAAQSPRRERTARMRDVEHRQACDLDAVRRADRDPGAQVAQPNSIRLPNRSRIAA